MIFKKLGPTIVYTAMLIMKIAANYPFLFDIGAAGDHG